jgi:protein SCO1
MMRWLAALLMTVLIVPAYAGLAPAQLDAVKADPKAGAAFALTLRFMGADGTEHALGDIVGDAPAVIVFADYTCTNLCGPILSFAAAGLAKTGLKPGRDYHLIVIGLDPKDGPAAADAMEAARIGPNDPVAKASVFLIGNKPGIEAATQAAGYHYIYDKDTDQFAHPAAAYVIASDGRIVRVLSGLGLTGGGDLRLALVDAGKGRIGNLLDQITLCCFGFDPARGIYTASITKILTIMGCMTVAIMAVGICLLALARRRSAAP